MSHGFRRGIESRLIRIAGFCLIVALLASSSTQGGTWYVNPTSGNDSNSGRSWKHSLESLVAAEDSADASPGDTIIIAALDTLSEVVVFDAATVVFPGTVNLSDSTSRAEASQPFIVIGPDLVADENLISVISGGDVTIRNCIVVAGDSTQYAFYANGGGRLVASKVHTRNGWNGFRAQQSSTIIANDCTVAGAWNGFRSEASSNVELEDCYSFANQSHGFVAYDKATLSIRNCRSSENIGSGCRAYNNASFQVANCCFDGNAGYGLLIESGSSASLSRSRFTSNTLTGIHLSNTSFLSLDHVLLAGSPTAIQSGAGGTDTLSFSHVTIADCDTGMTVSQGSVLIAYSIIFDTGAGLVGVGSGHLLSQHNLFWENTVDTLDCESVENSIHSDPMFSPSQSGSYQPSPFSRTIHSSYPCGHLGAVEPSSLPSQPWGRESWSQPRFGMAQPFIVH